MIAVKIELSRSRLRETMKDHKARSGFVDSSGGGSDGFS